MKKAPDLLVGRQSHTNTKMRHIAQPGAEMPFDCDMTLFLCGIPLCVIGVTKIRKHFEHHFINC